MDRERLAQNQKLVKKQVSPEKEPEKKSGMEQLQSKAGNMAVQGLIQRKHTAPYQLQEDTEKRIDGARTGGKSLDETTRTKMENSLGYNLKNVKIHTSKESDTLNKELGARAFTTGSDIFFRSGNYDPASSAGQKLLAHELTHVVQQGTGKVKGGDKMTVHAPDDQYEKEANSKSSDISNTSQGIQKTGSEEKDHIMKQDIPEEEEIMMQEDEENEGDEMEEVMMQEDEEEEEVMMQEVPEEEEVMMQEEEEEEEELMMMSDEEEEEEWIDT